MLQICDLHTHSVFSDGTDTPLEIIKKAEESGLSAVALCDHNTVNGLADFFKAAEGSLVEGISGVEISTDYNGTELHLLALYIPQKQFGAYSDFFKDYHVKKAESNRRLIASLQNAGYDIDYGAMCESTASVNFNRAHVAKALVDKGYFASVAECFKTVLSPKAGHYCPPKYPNVFDVIKFVKNTGAVPILAHPFLNLGEESLIGFLKKAVPLGLSGMETLYPLYDKATAERARQIALEFGILESGGSDYHGLNKPDIMLGAFQVPMAFAKRIKMLAKD